MKIVDITVEKLELGLRRPYRIAYKQVDSVAQLVVKLITDDGAVAVGTANPSPQVVGESVDDAFALLGAADLSFLLERDVREGFRLSRDIAARFAGHPGAAAALDMAVFDLFARAIGLPLCDVLGRVHDALPTSITIGIKNVDDTLAEADEYRARGFTILKVKLGEGVEPDMERLRRLRAHVGPDVVLRVDVNQGYDLAATRRFLAQARGLDLELCEQPVKADAIEGLRSLPADERACLYLDESVKTAANVSRVVGAAAGINVKLMKCGGVGPALTLATVAEHAGFSLMWGCNDESVVGITAALHAALACPATRHLDLDGSLDLAADIATGGFSLENGVMRPLDRPGLGLDIALAG